jgi:hypothetical protein
MTRDQVEDVIMSALRLAFMKKGKIKGSSMSAAAADDIHINPKDNDNDDNNDNIFYDAAANAFDHSPTVREYFHDNHSRTQSSNKRLWPLRYQAYKEYGI